MKNAELSILMVFLPQVMVWGNSFNVFRMISDFSYAVSVNNRSSGQIAGAVWNSIFIVPMILQLVWAILSFVRVRAAGVLGLIASIIFVNVSVLWLVFIYTNLYFDSVSAKTAIITPVPYLMVALSAAGLVLSIIQLTKKNRVR